ncbi:MAG TPA: hypothetical protein PLJ35_08775 [Anaerolineae bacterium]|nr:hypothetical protein [Anaerolineae bacterium]HOQ98901.1 hypothetical protein [Anaerolineae bacterium]
MTPAELQHLAARFARGPVMPCGSERHVYLWRGTPGALIALLPPGRHMRLDLHELAGALPAKPIEPEGARRAIARAIERALRAADVGPAAQQFVVVTGCELLMRYSVSLGTLYQAACDSRMVILVVPSYAAPAHPLPRYVEFRPDATYAYLKPSLEDMAIIQ